MNYGDSYCCERDREMIKRRLRSLIAPSIAVCWIALALAPLSAAQRQSRAPVPAYGARPKLVVVIMVDQFRYDFLERFEDLFGNDGFKRLMNGAFFTNANYDYIP